MPPIDTTDLAYGIPLIVVVPAIVEIAKANGLPTRRVGPGAIIAATILLALGDIALGDASAATAQRLAGWLIGGVVYGLTAAGFYSLTPGASGAMLATGQTTDPSRHRSSR